MTNSLPSDPSIEQLKKQAKDVHKAHKLGNESACDILKLLAKFADKSNQEVLAEKISLQQVQYAVAMNYGFESWQALRLSVADIRSATVLEQRDPVTRFVDKMLKDAIVAGASDLYFEPSENAYRVKFRTESSVHEVARPPAELGPEIARNLKVRAAMDIADSQHPKIGHIMLEIYKDENDWIDIARPGENQTEPIETSKIDFQVRTFPMMFGEKIELTVNS